MQIQGRKIGMTISAIKQICRQLELNKTVTVVGLKNADLYIRMIENEGLFAIADNKGENIFEFRLK